MQTLKVPEPLLRPLAPTHPIARSLNPLVMTNRSIILLNRLRLLIIKETKLRTRTVTHPITRDVNLITASRLGRLVVEAKVRLCGLRGVAGPAVLVGGRRFAGDGGVVVHLPVRGEVLGAVLAVDGLGDVAQRAVVAVREALVVIVARHVVVVQALALVGHTAFSRGLRLARGGCAVVFELELVAGAGACLVNALNADRGLLDL